MTDNRLSCFGLYSGNMICKSCEANKRCKAILVSHGFDIMASVLGGMIGDLPEDGIFVDTDSISETVNQILQPTVGEDESDEDALLRLLETKGIKDVDPDLHL